MLAGVLAVGLLLLGLGLPRLLGATARQPARSVLWALRDGKPLTDADLARGEAALERSRRWSGTPPHALSDLALLKLLRRERAEAPGAPLLVEAIEAQEAGLARAPAGGNSWARLAYARYQRAGLTEATREALELSLLSGGLDLPLLAFRLELILQEWDALGPAFHEAARGQIQEMTRHGRPGYDALVDIYRVSPRAAVIDGALADSPAQQAQFARRLARARR